MEQKFLTPQELFEDEQDLEFFNNNFVPQSPKQRGNFFWSVPAFLEDNENNLSLTDRITEILESSEYDDEISESVGNNFRLRRLAKVTDYTNEMFEKFDEVVGNNLWLGEPKREELIEKAEQLIIRSQYNMGYGQSGLYLDFNKFFEVFNNKTPFAVAERIIDNNVFLGNMATFYSILANDKAPKEECEKAKQNYLSALSLMGKPEVHFSLPKEKKNIFKYVEDGKQVSMVFFDDFVEDDLLVGFGPQFLYDAKLYKKDELNYIKDGGQTMNNEVKVEFELRNIDEQKNALEREAKLSLENAKAKAF